MTAARRAGELVAVRVYLVLANWKLAVVLEKSCARLVQGGPANPRTAVFGPLVLELLETASALARRLSTAG